MLESSHLESLLQLQNYQFEDQSNNNYLNIRTNANRYLEQKLKNIEQKDYFIKDAQTNHNVYKPVKISKGMKKMQARLNRQDPHFQEKELTEDEKNALTLLKLRKYIDAKNTMKTADFKEIPKKFQLGTVIDYGEDFQNRKSAKFKTKSFVDQFIQMDQANNSWSKSKFQQIQQEKQKFAKNRKGKLAKKFAKKIKKRK